MKGLPHKEGVVGMHRRSTPREKTSVRSESHSDVSVESAKHIICTFTEYDIVVVVLVVVIVVP